MTANPIRVLLIEDDPDDVLLLKESLAEASGVKIKLAHADRLSSGLAQLAEQGYDVILLDLNLPDSRGLDTLSNMLRRTSTIPIVVLSGLADDVTTIEAVRQGAQDYLVKGEVSGPMLARVLGYAIERKQAEQRLTAQYLVSRDLAESGSLAEASPKILQTICESLDCDHGEVWSALWSPDAQANVLRCAGTWQPPSASLPEFEAVTRQTEFAPGVGLPGRVWSSGEPAWIADVTQDMNFPRAPFAASEGLHAGFAFPIKIGNQVLGVMAFLSREIRPPDDDLLQMLTSLSSQISQFIERKRAEEALKLFRTLIDRSNDAIEVLDPETGRYLDVNEKGCLDLGYSREELLALTVFDIETAVDRSGFVRMVEALRKQGFLLWEGFHRRKDGSTYPVEVNIRYVQLDRDYVVTVVRDITERRRAEQALRESEERYRSVYENAVLGIYRSTTDGQILLANPALLNMLGYSSFAELSQRNLEKEGYEPGYERNIFRQKIESEGAVVGLESAWIRKDGTTIFVRESAKSIRDTAGKLMYYEGTVEDVSDRKQAEEETRLLLALTQVISEAPDSDSALRMVLQKVCESTTWVMGEAWIPRADGSALELSPNWYGQRPGLENFITESQAFVFPPGRGLPGRVWASRRSEWLTDVSVDGEIFPRAALATATGIKAALAVPASGGDQVLVLVFFMREAREEQRRLVEIVSAAAAQLGSLLQRKQAEDEQARLNAILQATTDMVATADPKGFVQYVNQAGRKMLGLGEDEDASRTRITEYHTEWAAALVMNEGIPAAIESGFWSGETAFLGRDGQVIPVSQVIIAHKARDGSLEYLSTIARDITERKMAEMETVRRLQNIQSLHEIDQAISGSFDLRVTLNILLEHVTTGLKVDAADVLVLDPHTLTLEHVIGRGFRGRALERTRLRLGEGQAGRAALERRTIQHPDSAASGVVFAQAELLAGENVAAYFAVPLIAKGEVKGVLEIFHRSPMKPDSEWLNFLETLAGQAAIAMDNAGLFDNLQRSNVELTKAYDSTIEGWSRALDLRDKETEGHTERVTELVLKFARAAALTEQELVHVRRGGLLHDIGKMGVSDHILLKPGKLTDEEWVAMRKHPTFALELLSPIAYLRPALDIPYCHHEKWDGTGYPRGLKGEQIPLAARLFAVVDVWDALRSDRPYRKSWPEDKVLEHIQAGSGTHFDPKAVELFLKVMNEDTQGVV